MISFYAQPRTAEEAVALAAAHPDAAYLAGGTDLVVEMHHHPGREWQLIDLSALRELAGIQPNAHSFGALTTFSQILDCKACSPEIALLQRMAAQVAATQIRNRGTLGGNICNANPAADSLPVLLVLQAEVEVADERGRSLLPLADFLQQRRNQTSPALLCRVRWRPLPAGASWVFSKIGRRSALSIARINLCGMACVEDGTIREVRLALGAVAPVAQRLAHTEAFLAGRPATRETLARASALAVDELHPYLAGRSSADYKLPVLRDLVEQSLRQCCNGGCGEGKR